TGNYCVRGRSLLSHPFVCPSVNGLSIVARTRTKASRKYFRQNDQIATARTFHLLRKHIQIMLRIVGQDLMLNQCNTSVFHSDTPQGSDDSLTFCWGTIPE